jgi:hypothetical protein
MHRATLLVGILALYHVDAIRGTRRNADRKLQTMTTVGQVENLRLINSDIDQAILNLTDNSVINLYSQSTANFNIQATTIFNSGIVGSVRFAFNGNTRFRTDSATPFSMCATNGGRDYLTCKGLGIGNHTVKATPYSNANATGAIGIPFQVTFRIVSIPPTTVPTKAPTNAPTKTPTAAPTTAPTKAPTAAPTKAPTAAPTNAPTSAPVLLCQVPQVRRVFTRYR